MSSFETISPIDGTILFSRKYTSSEEINAVLSKATNARKGWKERSVDERVTLLRQFVSAVVANKDVLATELTLQMGRPIRYSAGEISGFEQRATAMLDMAREQLADYFPPIQDGFTRFIRREPLGVVVVLSPWNYPYLTAVNAIIPALAAGNTVILKHSEQTALVAERLLEAANTVDGLEDAFQILHCTHDQVAELVQDSRVNFVGFTGSVDGGHAVQQAVSIDSLVLD